MTLGDLRQKLATISHLPDTCAIRIKVDIAMEEPLDEIETIEDLADIEVHGSVFGDPEVIFCM